MLLCALTLCSCGHSNKVKLVTDGAPGGAVESNSHTYYVVFNPSPNPIPLNQPFSVHVEVYQNANRTERAGNVTLSVDALMLEHNHGMNSEPTVKSNGGGSFDASG